MENKYFRCEACNLLVISKNEESECPNCESDLKKIKKGSDEK
jgi:Zn finger protein HypA/HybF involved in hydrogenase expression